MRISCLLLAAYAALAVAAPAQQRAGLQLVARAVDADGDEIMGDADGDEIMGDADSDEIMGSADESYYYDSSDDGYVTPEPPSDSEDGDFDPNKRKNTADSQYRLGFWRIHGTGDDGISMRAENTYPSYNTDYVEDPRNDNIPHYDYSPDIDNWDIAPLSRANALKTGRVLSAYMQFPSHKATTTELDTKFAIGKCPKTQDLNRVKTNANPVVRTGLSSGLSRVSGQLNSASFYHTEHVYEKQIISEFFKSVFTTADGAKWFKAVAENDLHQYRAIAPLYTLDAKLWSTTPAPAGWKTYNKVLGKTLADVVKDTEPKSHGSLATALGAVVGSEFRRDHLTALEAELNISKGRIFSMNEVHSEDRLKNLEKKECVKNPALLKKNADPDADLVFKDRMNMIKQPVVIWKYMLTDEVWEKFASTSSEVYRLLKIFDDTYAALQGVTDEAKKARKKRTKAVTQWGKTGPKTLPTGKKSLAEAYKKWLPTYMDAVIDKSAAYQKTSIDHMTKFYGGNLNGKFKASHVAIIEKEWKEFSAAKLKAKLKGAKIDACFMG